MTDQDGKLTGMMTGGGMLSEEGDLLSGLPFSKELGMRIHQARDGVAILSVPYDERLIGDPRTSVLHGGVITALLDTACGSAVMAAEKGLASTATLDLRIDYMRPAEAGKRVFARAECYRLTRTIGFTRAVAYEADPGDPVASAAGSFILNRTKNGEEKA